MLITREEAQEKQLNATPIFYAKYMSDKNYAGVTLGKTYGVYFYDATDDVVHIKCDNNEFDVHPIDNFDLYSELSVADILKDKWRESGLGEMDDTLLDILKKIGKDGVDFLLSEWDLVEQAIETIEE